ncbi:MAG: GNAT family N-acetyltransferase [Solirubrobacterales bacterium]
MEDAGEAASSEEFFRCPEFLAAEGVTHSLLVGEAIAAPLIVREIPGEGLRDAISPYGYPGASGAAEQPPSPADIGWGETELVSVFLRDRIGGDPCFAAGSDRGTVQICDPSRPSGVRPRLAEQIRATARAGYRVERLPGPEAREGARGAFERIYTETMRRAGAAERYFFGPSYFETVLGSSRSRLLLCAAPSGAAAAGAIAVLSDDVLHYFLGGTTDEHLDRSPMKNLFAEMIEIAAGLQVPLNLGGGVSPGDGLERFKRGFANAELPFRTHEIVSDPGAYDRLSAGAAGGEASFFPAYRAGASS